jgi:hypothetical protein
LGALVGLTGVVIGGLLTVLHQRRLEKDKALNARADALAKELAGAVQQLTISLASAVHSMCWLTWLAATRPDQLTQMKIDKYDDEQHVMLPKILGYLSTTAALDVKLYHTLRERVDEVFGLDAKIGEAGLSFKENPAASAAKLAAYFVESNKLERQLPRSVGDIVGARLRTPTESPPQ